MKTQVEFLAHLPKLDPNLSLLIYDRRLLRVSKEFRRWIKLYVFTYGVRSGEDLKNVEAFPKHVARLSSLARSLPARQMNVVAVGGGSVGDFAGFFASVFKRGVGLIHVPSTWLAAIDSSHGGKTALNASGAKNQIGSFYPAQQVILVRSLLFSQPSARVQEAVGELAKIALIDGGTWVKALARESDIDANFLWKYLARAIAAKIKIVDRDPLEKTGERQVLNLGHTIGHVLEASHAVAHGAAVAQGLFFAIEMCQAKKLLAPADAARALALLEVLQLKKRPLPKLSRAAARRLLQADKKRDARGQVTFIALKKIGRPLRVNIEIEDLLNEMQRQGLLESK